MRLCILLLTAVVLAGCASDGPELDTDGLTNEQKYALANKIIDARLQDGTDHTCWTIMSTEIWCRERTRDVNGSSQASQ